MDGNKFVTRIDGLLKQNRLLGLALIVMLIWNFMNWGMATSMQAKTQVVVVPIGSEGMQIGNGRASELYLRRMARYITQMIGTYTAATARIQLMELLDLFPPERSGSVLTSFEKIATDIERFPSISSQARWVGEQPLRYDESMIQVSVRKERLVNGTITDSKEVVYCLDYRIDETKFVLLNVRERERVGENTCLATEEEDETSAAS